MHPTRSAKLHQQRRVNNRAANSNSYDFFNLLTGPELLDQVEILLPDHRERLFPPTETLSMFLAQALSTDRSCQRAVNDTAIKRLLGGLTPCSTHTGAYCRARQRLPVEMVSALVRKTGQLMTETALEAWHWQGRPVRLVDGTTVSMPDTPANQVLKQTGGKILVTTLLCAKKAPKAAVKLLYRCRWHVELDLRNIKATLGLGVLSCKTPSMAEKEIWVYLLAYNLIRMIMVRAAIHTQQLPRELSFKHSLQLWLAWSRQGTVSNHGPEASVLLVLIAQKRVGKRPGRVEPRALKRRPKPYPLLNQPRQLARQQVIENGHPKNVK